MPLEYRFPPRTTVVCADGTDLHGCVGVVVGVSPDDATKVRVQLHVPEKEPPFGLNIASALREKSWVGAAKAAQLLKVTPDTLGRLSGGAWVSARTGTGRGKEQSYNVGLQLKGRSPDSGPIYLPGFVDRGSAQGQGGWKYSHAAIRLIAAYKLAWPQLIAAFDALPRDERTLDASRTIGAAAGLMLPKVLVWLSQLPTTKIPRVPMSSMVMSPAAVKAIEVTTAAIAAKSMQNPVQKVRRFILLRACFRKRGCSQRPFFSSCPLSLSLSIYPHPPHIYPGRRHRLRSSPSPPGGRLHGADPCRVEPPTRRTCAERALAERPLRSARRCVCVIAYVCDLLAASFLLGRRR